MPPTDFFISYTSTDKNWAEWVAYVLEEQRFKVSLQSWDFKPGGNFVLEMQAAAAAAERTIMILSPEYLHSQFAAPEWAAAFAQDPKGTKRKLIPVMVRSCQLPGLLNSIVHIDITGDDEATARTKLLSGITATRSKPDRRPSYPGSTATQHPSFPGEEIPRSPAGSYYVPRRTSSPTDADKRRYIRQAFEVVGRYFEGALEQLVRSNPSIEADFQPNTATDFAAEIFSNGKSTARCHIWLGGLHSGDGISYAEGSTSRMTGAINDELSICEVRGDLHLRSFMGISRFHDGKTFELEGMTREEAAEYLWRRFTTPLER